jgi:lipase chaperone LimK
MPIRLATLIKIAVGLVLAGAIITLWALARPGQPVGTPVAGGQPAPALAGVLAAPAANVTFTTGLEQLPPSLQGTQPPPGLIIDAQGNLVVTRALRDFFDYFLSALGEESLATIEQRVKAYMAKSLPVRADVRAEHIFEGYVNYRLALQKLPQAGGKPAVQLDIAAVTAQKQQEASLRSEYLEPDVVSAFFGDDDAYDRYTLARLQLERDKSLSEAQKKAQLQQLFAQLPAQTQATLQSMQNFQSLEQLNASCQQQGCTPDQLYQQRAALGGPEAADRLQALDQQRAAWKSRVDTYLDQRAAILANPSYSDGDKQAQIQQLQQSGFSTQEQLRLQAFEQMRDHGSGAASPR